MGMNNSWGDRRGRGCSRARVQILYAGWGGEVLGYYRMWDRRIGIHSDRSWYESLIRLHQYHGCCLSLGECRLTGAANDACTVHTNTKSASFV